MKLQIQCNLNYQANSYATAILSFLAAKSANQNILAENLTVTPDLKIEELTASNDHHRFARLEIRQATSLQIVYKATVEIFPEIIRNIPQLKPVFVAQMPATIISYLYPSRYCQSDQLLRFAQNRFGKINNDFARVVAITDWIYHNVAYVSGSSTSHTSALDTITEQTGVCRDFAHLGIAFCRALTIPARYFTCYAYKLSPPDFHACFEAYIGGKWIVFDATRLTPLNGLVKIAHGRDAADVAVATFFGDISLNSMQVNCQALTPDFEAVSYNPAGEFALSY